MKDISDNGKDKKSRSLFKIILSVIGAILILGLLSFGYIYGSNYLNARESNIQYVDGIAMVDNQSPENEIIQNYENISDAMNTEQEEIVAKEKEKIEKQIELFKRAIISKNPRKIAAHFIESEQDKYKEFFTENKDNLDVFEEIFSNMTFVYLSADDELSGDDLYKIAEYQSTWKDYEFSIVFIKEENKWLIMDL